MYELVWLLELCNPFPGMGLAVVLEEKKPTRVFYVMPPTAPARI